MEVLTWCQILRLVKKFVFNRTFARNLQDCGGAESMTIDWQLVRDTKQLFWSIRMLQRRVSG